MNFKSSSGLVSSFGIGIIYSRAKDPNTERRGRAKWRSKTVAEKNSCSWETDTVSGIRAVFIAVGRVNSEVVDLPSNTSSDTLKNRNTRRYKFTDPEIYWIANPLDDLIAKLTTK